MQNLYNFFLFFLSGYTRAQIEDHTDIKNRKGIIFVNGYNLGRYWNIESQQSLYLAGCWLKKGKNEIVIFEQQNDMIQKILKTTDQPVLEDLRPYLLNSIFILF